MVNESRKISKQPWFWILAATSAMLVLVVVLLFTNTDKVLRRERETPIPVPSVAPFVEQTITEEEMITLEKEALSPAGVDTSDWPTYTNKKYGYSFRYPEGMYIQGMTGFDKTNPEYASYLYLSAKFENKKAKYSRFVMGIKAEALDKEKDKCVSSVRLPLEQYMSRLRELNIKNNKEHKEWKDATISEVILLNNGKVQGYKLIFSELKFDGCTSVGYGGVNNHPLEVSRFYEQGNVRIRINNIIEENQQENPLYQVILDTLEFQEVEE